MLLSNVYKFLCSTFVVYDYIDWVLQLISIQHFAFRNWLCIVVNLILLDMFEYMENNGNRINKMVVCVVMHTATNE